MTTNFLPTSFKAYKPLKLTVKSESIKRRLHRFPYRYRLAKAFSGIQDGKQLGRSKAGYEAGMKVFLAYTAFEEIYDAAKQLSNGKLPDVQLAVRSNIELAKKIRSNARLKQLLLTNSNSKELQKSIDNFYKCFNSDILCVAYIVRNTFAHGDFTAGGAGLNRKIDCETFQSIAEEVLFYSDKLFTNCVEELERRQKKK